MKIVLQSTNQNATSERFFHRIIDKSVFFLKADNEREKDKLHRQISPIRSLYADKLTGEFERDDGPSKNGTGECVYWDGDIME